jgi:hypothetical protein
LTDPSGRSTTYSISSWHIGAYGHELGIAHRDGGLRNWFYFTRDECRFGAPPPREAGWIQTLIDNVTVDDVLTVLEVFDNIRESNRSRNHSIAGDGVYTLPFGYVLAENNGNVFAIRNPHGAFNISNNITRGARQICTVREFRDGSVVVQGAVTNRRITNIVYCANFIPLRQSRTRVSLASLLSTGDG